MSYMGKIINKIKSYPIGIEMSFSALDAQNISVDTKRKILHRLHEDGLITITKRGHFKREEEYRELLFVYGSLKKGFDNHDIIKKSTRRIGKAKTVRKFGMYEDSFGNYPYLTYLKKSRIEGELYEVKRKELMDKIDTFEGVPDYYQREKILVKTHRGKQKAFVYIQKNVTVPLEQEALCSWEENSDYKNKKFLKILSSGK